MGTGHSLDTPIRVAHFGINSVISLVDDLLCERIRPHYAKEFNLPVSAIASFTRGKTHEAAARHVVPYILHVVVGYSMTSAGACISRDRTSARYAITKTEDAREGKNKLLSQRIDNIEVEAIHLLLKYGMKLPS